MQERRMALACTIFTIASLSNANAATPEVLNTYDAWTAYSYRNGETVLCYAASSPKDSQPVTVDHGENYFIITRSGRALRSQAAMGYPLRPGSTVILRIGDTHFSMTPSQSHAWATNPKREPDLIGAMKHGHDMTLAATSKRGTQTHYTYSLKGVTAALRMISLCK